MKRIRFITCFLVLTFTIALFACGSVCALESNSNSSASGAYVYNDQPGGPETSSGTGVSSKPSTSTSSWADTGISSSPVVSSNTSKASTSSNAAAIGNESTNQSGDKQGASSQDPKNMTSDLYSDQLEASGAGQLLDILPVKTADLLRDNGLTLDNPNWTANITPKSVFKMIWDFLKDGGKTPFITAGALIAIMLLAAALNGFMPDNGIGSQFSNIVIIASASIILLPLFQVIQSSAGAIKGSGVFMLSFIPIYAGITISAGQVATATGFSTLLLGVSELVVQLASFAYVPITGAYLALNMTSAISPLSGVTGLADSIKKTATWIMTLTLSVFLGVLGIQTTVSAAADNVAIRTTKFIVTGSVPVVGAAIGESLATVKSCLALLRTSVGIYGVVAVALIMLPVIAQLMIWRLSLTICAGASQVLELPKLTSFLKAIDSALSVFVGMLLFISMMFIISLTMVVMAGGGAGG